jgi:hypothetical protein
MSVTITDNFTPLTWKESYPKTWGGDPYNTPWKSEFQNWVDSYPKTWKGVSYLTWKFGLHDYGLLATAGVSFADALRHTVSHTLSEEISVEDVLSREAVYERTLCETISLMETYWDVIQFRLSVSESFTVTDDETNKTVKGVLVTLHVSEKVPKSIVKPFAVTIFVKDSFKHKAKFIRKVLEDISIAELAGKHYKGYYQEMFGIVDFFSKMFTENVSETITFGELMTHAFVARRLFAETVDFDEICAKHTELNKEDLLSIRDTILQASNGILNNIYARHGEIASLEDFNKLVNQSPGFTEFIPFKVGEYDYEEALVKIAVRSKMEQSKPTVNNLTMHVDIPDTDDRGTSQITDTTDVTRVLFNKHYYNPPEVNVVLLGGNTGQGVLTPYITSVTTMYFEVEIRNSNLDRVTGSISWFAKGY